MQEKPSRKASQWAAGSNHPALTSETIPCHVPLSSGPHFSLPSHPPSFMTLEPIHHNIIRCTISSHCTEGPRAISPLCTQVMGWGMSHSAQVWPPHPIPSPTLIPYGSSPNSTVPKHPSETVPSSTPTPRQHQKQVHCLKSHQSRPAG